LRGDDAAGLRVAERIEELLRGQPVADVAVRTSTRAGLEIVDLLAGAARAVIVDCLVTPNPDPGRVHRLPIEACRGSARLVGSHGVSLADAIGLARSAGIGMPEEVEVYAIEAEDVLEIAERLSPAVARAVEELAREIHRRLQ
jgi:hydrogenase maturation protease